MKGSEGLKGYAVGRMTKSRRGKLYIDDAGWGPEAGSIEYGYRVPCGGIHVFISKIGELGPEPDICTAIVGTCNCFGRICESRGLSNLTPRDQDYLSLWAM